MNDARAGRNVGVYLSNNEYAGNTVGGRGAVFCVRKKGEIARRGAVQAGNAGDLDGVVAETLGSKLSGKCTRA